MAVFRIEKTRDYTVMSNHHLKDRTLTLKSKGLLSMMLSLPDEWNYTTRGLAAICREGVDSIGAALKELENHGYIRRTQLRNEKGKITDTVEAEIEAKELARIIEAFLDTLTTENRVIFMRRYWFSDSYKDIAEFMGLSEKNISVRLTRIREKMKQYLIEREVFV